MLQQEQDMKNELTAKVVAAAEKVRVAKKNLI